MVALGGTKGMTKGKPEYTQMSSENDLHRMHPLQQLVVGFLGLFFEDQHVLLRMRRVAEGSIRAVATGKDAGGQQHTIEIYFHKGRERFDAVEAEEEGRAG